MRRGGIPKEKTRELAIGEKKPAFLVKEVKKIQKRNSVQLVLQYFKQGKRDIKEAYLILKEEEEGDEDAIVASLEQLTDILCGASYFRKAQDILDAANKDFKNPILHELIARAAFIMENFDKCVFHNKKAADMQPEKCFHNWSDIGLAYYRMGLQQNNSKHFEQAMNYCQKSLGQNPKYANAMVNMGLVYKFQGQIKDSHKMFNEAHDADRRNTGAIVNLGCIEYEFGRFENAAISFLDALEIKPDDEEALCNLALALKKTPQYVDYAQIAFEEAINISPGNTFILSNYLMFLLQQRMFDQFHRVLPHARRVMDKHEIEVITNMHKEFHAAIEGTEGQVLPEDETSRPGTNKSSVQFAKSGDDDCAPGRSGSGGNVRSVLKNLQAKKKSAQSTGIQIIAEQEEPEGESGDEEAEPTAM